jgi:hypothetical protein
MKLTNFFSNLWIISNIENDNINKQDFINYISKIKQNHNIGKIINFDKEFKFWNNEISIKFNNTITTQIIIDNQKKTEELFKKISKFIISSLINQIQILIISINKNECLIGFIIFFICKYGGINLNKAMDTIESKLGCLSGYRLDENIKKILINKCHNK